MVTLSESNYGILATLEPDYLRCVNEETYMHHEDAEVDGVAKQEENASKAGQFLAWRAKGLLRRA